MHCRELGNCLWLIREPGLTNLGYLPADDSSGCYDPTDELNKATRYSSPIADYKEIADRSFEIGGKFQTMGIKLHLHSVKQGVAAVDPGR